MTLTRRDFGKQLIGAAAALALPVEAIASISSPPQVTSSDRSDFLSQIQREIDGDFKRSPINCLKLDDISHYPLTQRHVYEMPIHSGRFPRSIAGVWGGVVASRIPEFEFWTENNVFLDLHCDSYTGISSILVSLRPVGIGTWIECLDGKGFKEQKKQARGNIRRIEEKIICDLLHGVSLPLEGCYPELSIFSLFSAMLSMDHYSTRKPKDMEIHNIIMSEEVRKNLLMKDKFWDINVYGIKHEHIGNRVFFLGAPEKVGVAAIAKPYNVITINPDQYLVSANIGFAAHAGFVRHIDMRSAP